MSHISLYATLLVFLHSYQLQWRKTSYSKKKNPKCKIGINHIKKISDHCFWYSFSLTNSLSSVVAFLKISPMEDLKRNWVVISNDWNNKFRKETSQKSLFKFFFNSSGTRKIKHLQKVCNKEIRVTPIWKHVTLSIYLMVKLCREVSKYQPWYLG